MSEFFLKIVNMSISASWLLLAVLLLRLLLKKAPKWVDVLLWGIVAVRLICPFSIESVFSLLPSAETISPDIMMDWTPEISTGIGSLDAVVNPIITQTFAPQPIASANPLQIWIPVCANLWVLGILLMLAYTAVSYLLLRRRVAAAIALRNNIYQSDHVDSPFVLGIIKPKIYLPLRMDSRNLEHVIAHEQAHIRRKDHWWKPLGFLLLALHWFNPLMWLGYVLLCRDIELACDEKVIQSMDNASKADYTQALVDCSVNRRRIAACPLAFGEVGIKERVRSVMNYRKPAFWIVVAAVAACITVAVCLLTDPIGTGWSRLERITRQVGYTITDQQQKEITLTLFAEDLPDSIYSQEGCEFPEGKLVAYHDDTTQIYLKGARYSNEGTENLYFYLEFSYDLPREAGAFLYPVILKEDNISSSCFNVADKILRSDAESFPGAVLARGQDGGGKRLWFYVSTEALRKIQGTFSFDIQLNQITYQRKGAKQERLADSTGSVTVAQNSSAEEESELKLQVTLAGTDLSHPGQILADEIRQEWQRYEQLPELTRQASSHMWGTVYVDTDTWSQCENAVGVSVPNPLEDIDWLQKTGYLGMQSTNPQMYATHVKATAYATAQSNRRLDRIDMQSGYCHGDTRITLHATVCTENTVTTGMLTRGYATYETREAVTGSGLPVLLVTPKKANNTGYYLDGWCDQVAYWVEGNVFYTLRVVGSEENPTAMDQTMQDLLKEA